MAIVASIKFVPNGKVYYFDPCGLGIEPDDKVLVETAKGSEYAICVEGPHEVPDEEIIPPLRSVIRLATPADTERAAISGERNAENFRTCKRLIGESGLPMKLISVSTSFDDKNITVFFSAEGRIDFRALVPVLCRELHAKVDLRQIGVRDETKMLGGLGICGKEFCCKKFLNDFHPVSIKMAKTQGLSLNPAKISGTCGRLMCCLQYEDDAYQELTKRAPKQDAFVETPGGKGTVVSINLLRGTAKVRLEDGNDTTLKTFTFEELDVLGGKARRAEYQSAKAAGKLEEAGFKPSVIVEKEKPRVTDDVIRRTLDPQIKTPAKQNAKDKSAPNDDWAKNMFKRPAEKQTAQTPAAPRTQDKANNKNANNQRFTPKGKRGAEAELEEISEITSKSPKPEPIGKNRKNKKRYFNKNKNNKPKNSNPPQ